MTFKDFLRLSIIFLTSLFILACKESTKTDSKVRLVKSAVDSLALVTNRSSFLIDNCENSNFSAVLEEDKTKGKDSCILRIKSINEVIDKVETLNIPADRSSIDYCEKEYVVVGFACGGPCYSRVFVFTDKRPNKQFVYVQKISNNPSLIAHIKNEEFEKLIIHNLKNEKEQVIEKPDLNWMQYGQMDTLFMEGDNLKLEYLTVNKRTKKKSISIKELVK